MEQQEVNERFGSRADALSKVPPVGLHPRVLLSPSDIETIRAKVALGDKADRYFRVVWNDIKKARPMDHIHGLASSALVALVTEDQKLGRQLAGILVEQARYFDPMADIMNTHADMAPVRDNWYYYARTSVKKVGGVFYRDAYENGGARRIRELAAKGVEFSSESDRQSSGHLFNTVLRSYDYIYPFMTDGERTTVRRVIAKLTAGRYTAGMELPGNMFINNHMSMGEDLLILALAIEGEEGYDPRILEVYGPAVNNKISYDVSKAGHLHEKCKGFLPERAALAISRRTLPLLSNDHLRAMVWAKVMDSTCIRHGTPALGKRNEAPRHWWMGYGSGPWMDQFFNWAFLLKYVYPDDPVVDYFYKGRMVNQDLGFPGADAAAPLPSPRIRYTWRDIMLLTATDGLRHADGRVIDYERDGLPKEILAQKSAWIDLPRGVAMSRSSWEKDGLHIHYECRSDVFSAGHETPEAGDFNLVSHGVQWSIRRDWYMDCYFRNMVLIDGYAGVYSPVCGKLMSVEDNDHATTFISDQTDQYNWRKIEKNFYSWHNLVKENPWEAERWPGGKWGRDWEVPFHEHMRRYHEGIAGLDWGNWHGETRGPEMYQRWNRVDHVFRTLHMTKGEHPYVLIIDDVRKDSGMHQYDWLLHLEPDVTLWEGDSSVKNRHLEPGMPGDRTTDLAFQAAPKIPQGKAVHAGITEPGLAMNCYDRSSSTRSIPYGGLDPAHLVIADGERPYSTAPVLAIDGSDNAARLVEYRGFLIADRPGVYEFQLDTEGGNLLRIDGHDVVRNRQTAGSLPGMIELEQGRHTFSLRLAQSGPTCQVMVPGSDAFVPVQIGMFARPADVAACDDGRLVAHLDCEELTGDLLGTKVNGVKAIVRFGESVAAGKFGADKGAWLHIAMVYAPSKVELYVNGEMQSWQPKTEVARNAHVQDIKLFSGLEATVDDIRLYNKALLPPHISVLANQAEWTGRTRWRSAR